MDVTEGFIDAFEVDKQGVAGDKWVLSTPPTETAIVLPAQSAPSCTRMLSNGEGRKVDGMDLSEGKKNKKRSASTGAAARAALGLAVGVKRPRYEECDYIEEFDAGMAYGL